MIRFAKKEDGPKIVELLMVIFEDMGLNFVEKYGKKQTSEVLLQAMADKNYRYSYQRGIVYEIDGEVAGAAFGFPAREEPAVDQPLADVLTRYAIDNREKLYIEPEAFPDEWYLDSVSVDSDFRGQGIGSQLLGALPMLIKKSGEQKIGLSVAQNNPAAKKLYSRMGFEVVGEKIISGQLYEHMQKQV